MANSTATQRWLDVVKAVVILPFLLAISPPYLVFLLLFLPGAYLVSRCVHTVSFFDIYLDTVFWPFTHLLDIIYLPFWKLRHHGMYLYVDLVNQTAQRTLFAAQPPHTVRFVCVSDTHLKHGKLDVPDGDVFLHAGDILLQDRCSEDSVANLGEFNAFLAALPHPHKVVVAGNHDLICQKIGRNSVRKILSACVYLENESLGIPNPWGSNLPPLNIWGSPSSVAGGTGNTAFQLSRDKLASLPSCVPPDTDIILVHSFSPLWLQHKSPSLSHASPPTTTPTPTAAHSTRHPHPSPPRASAHAPPPTGAAAHVHTARARAPVMVCGHFHARYGARFVAPGYAAVLNAASVDRWYTPTHVPIVFDLPVAGPVTKGRTLSL